MSEPAAILATFSDLKLIRGRKCAQLVFEVPIEQAKQAIDALGMPNPAGETWCGIARITKPGPTPQLDKGPVGDGAKGEAAPSPKPNSTRAVMMAKDADAQRYLRHLGYDVENEQAADAAIKEATGVKSKAELNDGVGAQRFQVLRDGFRSWRAQGGRL